MKSDQELTKKKERVQKERSLKSMLKVSVENADEVLKLALTKELKRVEWVEVDKITKNTNPTSVSSNIN